MAAWIKVIATKMVGTIIPTMVGWVICFRAEHQNLLIGYECKGRRIIKNDPRFLA